MSAIPAYQVITQGRITAQLQHMVQQLQHEPQCWNRWNRATFDLSSHLHLLSYSTHRLRDELPCSHMPIFTDHIVPTYPYSQTDRVHPQALVPVNPLALSAACTSPLASCLGLKVSRYLWALLNSEPLRHLHHPLSSPISSTTCTQLHPGPDHPVQSLVAGERKQEQRLTAWQPVCTHT